MSFVAGFGETFSQGMRDREQAKRQEKQDLFKLTYSEYIRRREKREENQAKDAQTIRLAKSLAQTSGAPDGSWVNAYEWLKSGMDQDMVLENLSTGKFENNGPTVENPGSGATPSPDTTPVDNQTREVMSGMQDVSQQQGMPSSPQVSNSPWGNIRDKLLGPKRPKMDETYDKIGQITQTDPSQVRSTLEGGAGTPAVTDNPMKFTPGTPARKPDAFANGREASIELAQAETAYKNNPTPASKERFRVAQERMDALLNYENLIAAMKAEQEAKANGVNGYGGVYLDENGKYRTGFAFYQNGQYVDPQGNPLQGFRPYQKGEQENYFNLYERMGKKVEDYNSKSLANTAVLRDVGYMGKLIEETNGQVLSSTVGGLAQTAQRWALEINTALDVLRQEAGDNSPVDADRLQDLENRINDAISQGVNDLGTARALFEAKGKIVAYRLAASMGQEGRSLSETERKIFEELMQNSTGVDKFYQKAGSIVFSEMRNLEGQAFQINDDNSLRAFDQAYGWKPFEPVRPIETLIERDPELKQSYDMLKKYESGTNGSPVLNNTEVGSNKKPVNNVPEGLTPIGKTPDGRTVYRTKDGRQVVPK